ncbi:hypothetical protein R1sor_004016 [Riccia sorocarpa]|uniref:Uncharacterized protein n=1 Tax=Riccia sorocarpa TaxID=122646 RepID=A0ABD3H632_9MARC
MSSPKNSPPATDVLFDLNVTSGEPSTGTSHDSSQGESNAANGNTEGASVSSTAGLEQGADTQVLIEDEDSESMEEDDSAYMYTVQTTKDSVSGRLWHGEGGNSQPPEAKAPVSQNVSYLNTSTALSAQKQIGKKQGNTLKSQARKKGEIQVKSIMHDGREDASDHIPVKVDFMMEGSRRSRVNRAAYIKMDIDTFTDPASHGKFKEAWLEGWSLSPDPIVGWELAWGWVRQLYAEFTSEDQSIRSKLQGKKLELEALRIQIAEDPTSVNTVAYRDLETWVWKADLLEHQILRRSRLTWVRQGDACTKFFFAKSKQLKERLAVIVTDDGRTLTEETEIFEEVHDYYKDIYQQPEITDDEKRARDNSLQLIQSRVPEQEKRRIAEKPTMKELEQTVESMAKEKAPGEDGLTIEVLLASWGWTGQACLQLLLEFWRHKSLGRKNLSAVVKLLPKSDPEGISA